MDPDIAVYAIESYMPHPAGTPGSICCATTTLMAGDVAGEYFMTRGHFHQDPDGPEMTICVSGDGWLVLMDEHRQPRVERMTAGSVHHVGLRTAHRAVNVGTDPLVFVSFWASEIGHDYATIAERGFSMRLRRGQPSLV
jgi:glucose-6-phosphate isomerase